MPTYYEEHKAERKAYQIKYREINLDEVRRKDLDRKRKKKQPDVFLIEKNVRVAITDPLCAGTEPPTAASPRPESSAHD